MTEHFIPLKGETKNLIPAKLNDPFEAHISDISRAACQDLQDYLAKNQGDWTHNFGLTEGKTGLIKGKMFGALVVEGLDEKLGYICTFSGKLRDNLYPSIFVPSLFDLSTDNNFLNNGMTQLTKIGRQIKSLETEELRNESRIKKLKEERKNKSIHLQEHLFKQYNFLNEKLEIKNLLDIFFDYNQKKPPSGAGECTAPKLLHYAYQNNLKPIAIAEFWWGQSTLSEGKVHKEFYPACHDKCRPILGYMLG